MELNYFSIGARIRMARKAKRITQIDFSEMIDRSPTFLSHIEKGSKRMSLDTFVRIANALEVSADSLLADNLIATETLESELSIATEDCTEYERQVLLDIVVAAKESLRENAEFFNPNHNSSTHAKE